MQTTEITRQITGTAKVEKSRKKHWKKILKRLDWTRFWVSDFIGLAAGMVEQR